MCESKTPFPTVESQLRHNILKIPPEVYSASGIVINGRRIKRFVFTTDLAIIRNCDADAVFAVYPFTPQQAISDAIIKASYIPVLCGVGGGTTKGIRTVSLAKDVECQGAMGVVLNAPISDPNLLAVAKAVDIPVIITVTKEDTDIEARLRAGASILNVAAGPRTPDVVRSIREKNPQVPVIASDGKTGGSIRETIAAGANAITFTPPSTQELFKEKPYEQMTHPGERVQVDVKVVPRSCVADPELRLFQYTATDEFTRLRFLAAYPEQSAYSSADFLRKLTAWYARRGIQVECVQTDNGFEFTNRFSNSKRDLQTLFEKPAAELGIRHKLIRPYTPRHNGKVERSHREDQKRFYSCHDFYSLDDFAKQLAVHHSRSNNLPMRPLH